MEKFRNPGAACICFPVAGTAAAAEDVVSGINNDVSYLPGVPICSWQVTSDISMSFAIGIADSYNQRLLESF